MKITIRVKDKKLRRSSRVRKWEKATEDVINAEIERQHLEEKFQRDWLNLLLYGTSSPSGEAEEYLKRMLAHNPILDDLKWKEAPEKGKKR